MCETGARTGPLRSYDLMIYRTPPNTCFNWNFIAVSCTLFVYTEHAFVNGSPSNLLSLMASRQAFSVNVNTSWLLFTNKHLIFICWCFVNWTHVLLWSSIVDHFSAVVVLTLNYEICYKPKFYFILRAYTFNWSS